MESWQGSTRMQTAHAAAASPEPIQQQLCPGLSVRVLRYPTAETMNKNI